MRMARRLATSVALLAACSNGPNRAPPDIGSMIGLGVTDSGLDLYVRETETTRHFRFGVRRAVMLNALAYMGKPETKRLDKCRAGPLDAASWPKGLTLFFRRGKWVGWAAGPRRDHLDQYAGVVTTRGVGPGSLQEEAAVWHHAHFFDSRLGLEFRAGKMSGLVDGIGEGARVTDMWAGVVCRVDDEPPSRAIDSARRLAR